MKAKMRLSHVNCSHSLFLGVVFAVIRQIHVLIRLSSEILWPVSIDTLRPIVFDVLLWTVSSFISVHIKHVWFHLNLLLHQIFCKVSSLVTCNIKRHYNVNKKEFLLALFFFWELVGTKGGGYWRFSASLILKIS